MVSAHERYFPVVAPSEQQGAYAAKRVGNNRRARLGRGLSKESASKKIEAMGLKKKNDNRPTSYREFEPTKWILAISQNAEGIQWHTEMTRASMPLPRLHPHIHCLLMFCPTLSLAPTISSPSSPPPLVSSSFLLPMMARCSCSIACLLRVV